jgi:hypothetical protein
MSQLEIETVTHLAWAWNAYCSLEDRDCDDDREMQVAIHAAQAVLAVRMARRTEPGVWSAAVRKDAKT